MKLSNEEMKARMRQQEEDGKILRGVILELHTNQVAITEGMNDKLIVAKIISRLYHDRLVRINTKILDTSLELCERVKVYMTDEHDATYGRAMAYRFGHDLSVKDAIGYDVLKYRGDMRIMLTGDDLVEMVRYLRSIGGVLASPKITPTTDGVNHINVYSRGVTEIGRVLSNFEPCEIETNHGTFASLEGYYHWLRIMEYHTKYCGHDLVTLEVVFPEIKALRKVSGTAAISKGRTCKQVAYDKTGYRPGKFEGAVLRHYTDALIKKLFLPYKDTTIGAYTAELILDGFSLTHYYYSNSAENGTVFPKYGEWLPELIVEVCKYIDVSGEAKLEDVLARIDDIINDYEGEN